MTRRTTLRIAIIASGSALALGAMAAGGGGGGGMGGGGMGGGGMAGGGMGRGGGMGMGASMSADHGMSPQSNMGQGNSGVSSHTATTALNNTKLDGALTEALGKSGITIPGGDLKTACAGFRNLGGCVAALHVANNLNLTGGFTALKALVTGSNPISLGKAITQLDASADSSAAMKQANVQTHADLDAASRT